MNMSFFAVNIGLMLRTHIIDTKDLIGREVRLFGWVHNRRDHGKLIFLDLRDKSGIIQVVFTPSNPDIYINAEKLRSEWVVRIRGRVQARPEKMINPELETGNIELEPLELEILNEAMTPPFGLDTDGYEIGEENRMKYRYVDLRRQRMSRNITSRHKLILQIRNWLDENGFVEIETPILTKSTPEGARDYVVPSRLYPGKFFALPQSPQQYKQLLMVGGVEKYFQIARCFRDEDTRGDRQPEFTQLDLEMSFVEREDVIDINEKLLIHLVTSLYPDKKIQNIPFPRFRYRETLEKYGTDRPDIREDKSDPNILAFCWIIDFPFFEKDKKTEKYTFTHNPFSAPKPEFMNDLMGKMNIDAILTSQYDVVLNGSEIGGGSIRNHQAEALETVFEIMGFEKNNIRDNFGHMLEALESGAPPHGGIAWGLDRFVTILNDEPNIREVIAFPKTGDARDLMMDTPSQISLKQLKELRLKIDK